jgi:hypothetical protein
MFLVSFIFFNVKYDHFNSSGILVWSSRAWEEHTQMKVPFGHSSWWQGTRPSTGRAAGEQLLKRTGVMVALLEPLQSQKDGLCQNAAPCKAKSLRLLNRETALRLPKEIHRWRRDFQAAIAMIEMIDAKLKHQNESSPRTRVENIRSFRCGAPALAEGSSYCPASHATPCF